MTTLKETLSSQDAFALAVRAALESDRSPAVIKTLVFDGASSARLFNFASEHGVDSREMEVICCLAERDLQAYAQGEKILGVYPTQKLLERLDARL
jgi:hypothetical protein